MTSFLVLLAMIIAAGGAVYRARKRRVGRQKQAAVDVCLAPTVDLIAVVAGAGGSLAEAVEVVAENGPEAIRSAFGEVVASQRKGLLLADALAASLTQLGPAFHPTLTTLIVAEQSGTPVGLLLQRLADEAQLARDRTVAEALGRLPVALLIPLVVCQLPALVIGSVIPLTIVALRHLSV